MQQRVTHILRQRSPWRPEVELQRVGEAEDIAAPVCFLLSDEAGFMTGTVTVPDGGETLL